jgi:hypothetical protein
LVYESENILSGEIRAMNEFLFRAANNGNCLEYSVEDLLLDEFFEADKFYDLFESFMTMEIENKTQAKKITSLEEVENSGKN